MSQIAIRNDNEPRTSIQNVAFGQGESGGQIAPQNLGDILRFAEVMARADVAIPKHLRDNPGACLAVCMQAFNWEMNPFAVAQKSYKVGDQMAYEAQLIAAVINTRAGLKRRPKIEYDGAGQDRRCIVTFDANDGSTHVYESPRFAAITTKNSPLWKSDPDQQLGYYSVRAGARRHFPEVILGVYDREELESVRDVTPARPSLQERFAARPQETSAPHEGFGHELVSERARTSPEPQTAAGEPQEPSTDDGASIDGDALPADGVGNAIDPDAPAAEHEDSAEEAQRDLDATQSNTNHDPVLRNLLTECAAKMLEVASGPGEPSERQAVLVQTKDVWKAELPNNGADLKKIVDRSNSVITGKLNLPTAVTMIATELGLKEADIRPVVR